MIFCELSTALDDIPDGKVIENLPSEFSALNVRLDEIAEQIRHFEAQLYIEGPQNREVINELALELAYFARLITEGEAKHLLINLQSHLNYAFQMQSNQENIRQELDSLPKDYKSLSVEYRRWLRRTNLLRNFFGDKHLSTQEYYEYHCKILRERCSLWKVILSKAEQTYSLSQYSEYYRYLKRKVNLLYDRLVQDVRLFINFANNSGCTPILSSEFRRVLFTSDLSRLEPPQPPQFNLPAVPLNSPTTFEFFYSHLDEPNNRQISGQAHANLPLNPLVIPAI